MLYDAEHERELLRKTSEGEKNALEELTMMHMPFIRSAAKRIQIGYGMEEELVQAGCAGFLKAVARFDPSCGTKFLTYAFPWIIGEMKRVIHGVLSNRESVSLYEPAGEECVPLCERIEGAQGIDDLYVDLHIALSKLSRDEQILITLRYYRDQSQAETARLLKKSQAQISKIERKALDRLNELLH